jgi:hypothetical protein
MDIPRALPFVSAAAALKCARFGVGFTPRNVLKLNGFWDRRCCGPSSAKALALSEKIFLYMRN